MKVHQLKALVAIGDQGSIRAASRASGLSPAAVTKAVRELEEDLRTLLITREAKGVTFTEASRALLVHARLVWDSWRAHRTRWTRSRAASRPRCASASSRGSLSRASARS